MKSYDVVTAYVSFTQGNGGKRRSVLIIFDDGENLLVFSITSRYEKKSERIKAKYYKLQDWQALNLKKQSYIDTNQAYQIGREALTSFQVLGHLSQTDINGLDELLMKERN
ncbi:hypothetical protein GPK34_00340 [Secundilactobacillus kimchicus]|uniref:type II toxin-antitoxin system PemK/MazF family toxin n=1 Tax=Secundilactobacillus kimchicus TaxID=528209 RepID=UPI001C0157DF|nr:type II toxin-antitoxin system PemK/MazF family toxin [Secundilactobacillus kimchicus]MBT9670485.1 hypothetical protein [Secundilactobacillus kimchicus]